MKLSKVKEFQRVSPSVTILKNSANSVVGRVEAVKATMWKLKVGQIGQDIYKNHMHDLTSTGLSSPL